MHATLVNAIQADPLDPLARLALADWIEETYSEEAVSGYNPADIRLTARVLQHHKHAVCKVVDMPSWFKALLKRLGQRKRTVTVRVCREVYLTGCYWEGGSKSSYQGLYTTRTDGATFTVGYHTNPFAPPPPPYALLPGCGILETSIFCGKPGTPVLHVHPDDCLTFLRHLVAG